MRERAGTRAKRESPNVEVPGLGEPLEFLRLVWALDHALQSRSKRMQKTIGLTGPQRLVIRVVSRYPGILAGELAAVLHLHPSTLTGILDRLEGRRLLRRRVDDRDRRRAVLDVTTAGRRLDVPSPGTIESSVSRALAVFPRADLDAAREVLTLLTKELSREPEGNASARATNRRGRRRP